MPVTTQQHRASIGLFSGSNYNVLRGKCPQKQSFEYRFLSIFWGLLLISTITALTITLQYNNLLETVQCQASTNQNLLKSTSNSCVLKLLETFQNQGTAVISNCITVSVNCKIHIWQ